MSFYGNTDFGLEVAKGNVPGHSQIFKFGKALDCDSGVPTDIWDGADGVTSTDIWVPPTVARVHNIASSSDADNGGTATGMLTVRIFGLTDWDTAEVTEDVTLNGTANVATVNSYVIINGMRGLTFGSGETNAGIITATAVTDATITAAIQVGRGSSAMCIYGVPSTKTLYMTALIATILRAAGAASADGTLLIKENADLSTSGFITRHVFGTSSDDFYYLGPIEPPVPYVGPCIVKVQVNSNVNNSECTASFNAYLVDN